MGSDQTACECPTSDTPRVAVQLCPICGGTLAPLRNVWRCSRCYFSLCIGCEGETAAPAPQE
jgi:hypothetical protein